jgi:acyl-CoA hydrolase
MSGLPALARVTRTLAPDAFLRSLAPGTRLFLQGAAGEPVALTEALAAGHDPGLALTANFVPGINPVPIDRWNPATVVASVFMQPNLADAERADRFRHLPVSYAGFAKLARETLAFDIAAIQVAPPGPDGRCSLGPTVEFATIAMARAARIVAVVNPQVPALPGAPSLDLAACAAVVEADGPLREYVVGAPSAEAQAIAGHVAALVGDGTALQLGLGKVPDALYGLLRDRRDLRLRSGMLSDGVRTLAESGALDPGANHVACVHVGSAGYYRWLAERPDITTRGCEITHDLAALAATDRLVAVNAALEVDLIGQANLETAGGLTVSGVAGAADFARGARVSRGGISIVALPATYDAGRRSRIVARLDGPVSLPRTDIDIVVTEHGVADLRAASVAERAERLIAVAAPQHRAALTDTLTRPNRHTEDRS